MALTGAKPADGAPLDSRISNIASLQRATASELAFFENAKYAQQLASTHAGACLVTERFASLVPKRTVALRIAKPYRAFVMVARKLFPEALRPSSLFEAKAVAPGAFVHDSARLEHGVTVDPGVVIGPRAEIGAGTRIAAGAVIGPDVRIGRDCSIGAVTSIMHALIGDRVTIHPGCRIGQDGFGFVPGPKGHVKIPQIGRVIIQDDVEIGAGTTVDRGALGDTSIGEGTKIDNLVQVGHNVTVGRHCLLARWGTELHDRFMLPHFVWQDFEDVIDDLQRSGYPLRSEWFAPHFEFRFPHVGAIAQRGIHLGLRTALEPWHVLGEEPTAGGAVRYVDSSLERLQVHVRGLVESRFAVACNGRRVPLHPTGTIGEYVAGVRYRAWQPPSCLQPTIGAHAPLVFDIIDEWNNRSLGGCTYHVAHPGGLSHADFPVNAYAAESRRLARFSSLGHTPGPMDAPPRESNREFPFTLDLRRS